MCRVVTNILCCLGVLWVPDRLWRRMGFDVRTSHASAAVIVPAHAFTRTAWLMLEFRREGFAAAPTLDKLLSAL